MTATFQQREAAAEVLRAGGTQVEAARAAGVDLSTLKRWLKEPSFQALIVGSPDIRAGRPQRLGDRRGVPESQRDLRCRLWVAADGEVLGSYIPPAAFESAGAVLHVHVVQADAVEDVVASIGAGAYPADSPYVPVPLAGLNENLLDNLPLVCRLGSPDASESLAAWLELWTFIDEEGRTRTLAESFRRQVLLVVIDGQVQRAVHASTASSPYRTPHGRFVVIRRGPSRREAVPEDDRVGAPSASRRARAGRAGASVAPRLGGAPTAPC